MEARGYQITKLTGENYFNWKLKMQMVLQKEKLWSMITKESPTTINDEWRTRDQSARATIGLALDDKLLILLTDCETAKQTWLKLKTTYEHSNLTNKLFLLKRLYGSKFEAFKNMEDYLNSIKELAERLRVIGERIKESHIVAIMLCGLPAAYDALVTAIETREEKEINLEYVCAKLRDEAARKESHNVIDQETAMLLHERTGVGMRRGRIICHNCGQEGHIRRNCELINSNKGNKPGDIYQRSETYPNKTSHNSLMSCEKTPEESINLNEEWALSGIENNERKKDIWILDSGASAHMTPYRSDTTEIMTLSEPKLIHLANGTVVKANEKGEITLNSEGERSSKIVTLSDVLIVPELKMRLISVKSLCKKGLTVIFNTGKCVILDGKEMLFEGRQEGNVFIIVSNTQNEETLALAACIHTWHRRFGHRSITSIKHMLSENLVSNLKIDKCEHNDYCDTCQLGTMTKRTFSLSTTRVEQPFKLVVTDLCGPISPATLGGNKYFLTLTDQFSGFVQVKLLKSKHEAVLQLINLIQNGFTLFGYFPQIVRSDGGGEYQGKVLSEFFDSKGITHQTTVPHTPEQNGQAERMNRTLLNEMRCLIIEKKLPKELWGEAALTSAYLSNLVKSTVRGKTPIEMWYGKIPSVQHLRIFGSTAYAYVPKSQRKKLDKTSVKGILVGYGLNKKSYRLWIPGTRKIVNETTVSFKEENDQVSFPDGTFSDNYHTIPMMNWEDDDDDGQNAFNQRDPYVRRSIRNNIGIPAKRLTY